MMDSRAETPPGLTLGGTMSKDIRTSTNKGYSFTEGQIERIRALLPFAENGPDYRRGVRDSLTSVMWAEDAEGVDYFLTHAEAALPGAPVITETIRSKEFV